MDVDEKLLCDEVPVGMREDLEVMASEGHRFI